MGSAFGASSPLRVGIGVDELGWHLGFKEGVQSVLAGQLPHEVSLVTFEAHDWVRAVEGLDAVVWKPVYMGREAAEQFRARIVLMEQILGLLVVPNVATTWHFENKAAQADLFRAKSIPTPATWVALDPVAASKALKESSFPIVTKDTQGAASRNVRLVRTRRDAERTINRRFAQLNWHALRRGGASRLQAAWRGFADRWLGSLLWERILNASPFRVALWQEFVRDNDRDLRITVIGDDVVFAFWRLNRDRDFRASGSGKIQYDPAPPPEMLRYFVRLNRTFKFDSMSYDILTHPERGFVVTEMSYAYNDRAIYDAPRHWRADAACTLREVHGHAWPQRLWGEWAGRRILRAVRSKTT